MYISKSKVVNSSITEIDRFIEGNDYFNSSLLYRLDRYKEFLTHKIDKFEHRADLISSQLYGGKDQFSWVILYLNKCSVEDLIKGKIIKYIPEIELDKLMKSN